MVGATALLEKGGGRATSRRNRYVVAMTPVSAPTALQPTAPNTIRTAGTVLTTRTIHARRDGR
jgi:hypothetical protein